MAFTAQVPGSIWCAKCDLTESPRNGTVWQRSCYSYFEKISALTNPVCFQSDVVFPNALTRETFQLSQGSVAGAQASSDGCKGHQIWKEFLLESRTPVAVPLLMYPTDTRGRQLYEVDMCALPVLNWEAYIHDVHLSCTKKTVNNTNTKLVTEGEEEEEVISEDVGQDDRSSSCIDNQRNVQLKDVKTKVLSATRLSKLKSAKQILIELGRTEGTGGAGPSVLTKHRLPEEDLAEQSQNKTTTMDQQNIIKRLHGRDKISLFSLRKFKNQPELKVEGTWNHYFGGQNGACCFVKHGLSRGNQPMLFVGKGSHLRALKLGKSTASSILSYKVDSVWESSHNDSLASEDNSIKNFKKDLLASQIFQIQSNQRCDVVSIRRGKSVDIYSAEDEVPYLLETLPNVLYGTKTCYPHLYKKKVKLDYLEDPFLLGLDFNPSHCSEICTIDENWVVRFCDFTKGITDSLFCVPRDTKHISPPGYPSFKLNEAAGISYAHFGKMFYAWANSIVYLGDRREMTTSRSNLSLHFDLRNHLHLRAISEQNYFNDKQTHLNEYISCLRRSEQDQYYYVGTTSNIYLMDLRVPFQPVIKMSHGLQSPLTYMNTHHDGNFEVIVGGSQRLPETVCVVTDMAHINCIDRFGCAAKNPTLTCYPRHLSNSMEYFEVASRNGYEFPMPRDHDVIRDHHYAWSTGLAVCPVGLAENANLPGAILVVTSNNFGDIFIQEWGQKPLPVHKTTGFNDIKLREFVSRWRDEMISVLSKRGRNPRMSKNPLKSVNCTVLVDPAAEEIGKLGRIRNAPFDCYTPDEFQYERSTGGTPFDKLICQLRKFKNERATKILDVWSNAVESRQNEDLEIEEEAAIKQEPPDPTSPSQTSFGTIDVDENEWARQQDRTEAESQEEAQTNERNRPKSLHTVEHSFLGTEYQFTTGIFPEETHTESEAFPFFATSQDSYYENSQPSQGQIESSSFPLKKKAANKRSGFL